mmetsp:Transcript_10397/g.14418  ORF Transcript_10397/g.14418 Transcript_10397/m.14418 type:complete len:270 (+) Transcript_10397:133-942(+)
MTFRNKERAKKAVETVREEAKDGKVYGVCMDLGNLHSVREAAEEIKKLNIPVHGLINNAGVMMCPYGKTKDGIETQFGVNHIGHFLFTALIYPLLKASAEETKVPSRIVNVSSSYHRYAPKEGILFGNLDWNDGKAYEKKKAYGHSKYANIVFTKELSARLGDNSNVIVNAIHPGFVKTDLSRHIEKNYGKMVIDAVKFFGALNVTQGALTQLYAATSPEVVEKGYRGEYFVPIAKKAELNPHVAPVTEEMRKELWELSEKLTKTKFEI